MKTRIAAQGAGAYVFVTEAGTPNNGAVITNDPASSPRCEATVPGASAHTAAFDRIQARQRWPRHAISSALSRASQFATDCAVYRVGRRDVREVLAALASEPRLTARPR